MTEFFFNFLEFFKESNWWIPSLYVTVILGAIVKGIADSASHLRYRKEGVRRYPLIGKGNWHFFTNLQDILSAVIGGQLVMRILTFDGYTGITFILDLLSVFVLRSLVFGFVYKVNKSRTIRAYYSPEWNTKKLYYPKIVKTGSGRLSLIEGYIATDKFGTILIDSILIAFLTIRYILR